MLMDYKKITRDELKTKLDNKDDFLLVNVLSAASFETLRIKGSINIDIAQPDFLEQLNKATGGDTSKEIVVYCSSAVCQASPSAARKLSDAGYMNVSTYEGGLADWREAQYPMQGALAK